jgi:hypothetical protein
LLKPGEQRRVLEQRIEFCTTEKYVRMVMGDMGAVKLKERENALNRSNMHMISYGQPRYNDFTSPPVANKRRGDDKEVVNAAQVELISHFVFV